MSFKIGKINIIIFTATAFLAVLMVLRKLVDAAYVLNPKGIFFIFSIFGFSTSAFMTLSVSQVIWETFPFMDFFQYPWRFLLMTSFFSALLAGFFVWLVAKSISVEYHSKYLVSYILTILLVGGAIGLQHNLFSPQTILPKTTEDYIAEEQLKWNISKISDEYMPRHFDKPQSVKEIIRDKIEVHDGNMQISNVQTNTLYVRARTQSEKEASVRLNIAYFPSWRIYVDDELKNYTITGKGLLVKVPAGNHIVEARFVSTPFQTIANILSLVGVISILVGIIFSLKKAKI